MILLTLNCSLSINHVIFSVMRFFITVAMERISENMHLIANEPSLALYRLQEHVRKSLPFMVEKRTEVMRLHEQLQGRCYDVDYAVRYSSYVVFCTKVRVNISHIYSSHWFLTLRT